MISKLLRESAVDQWKAAESERDKLRAEVVAMRKLLCDSNRGAEVNMQLAKNLTERMARLRLLAETYIAAVECYNGNQWDRVNVRKYAAAKDALREELDMRPNTGNKRRA